MPTITSENESAGQLGYTDQQREVAMECDDPSPESRKEEPASTLLAGVGKAEPEVAASMASPEDGRSTSPSVGKLSLSDYKERQRREREKRHAEAVPAAYRAKEKDVEEGEITTDESDDDDEDSDDDDLQVIAVVSRPQPVGRSKASLHKRWLERPVPKAKRSKEPLSSDSDDEMLHIDEVERRSPAAEEVTRASEVDPMASRPRARTPNCYISSSSSSDCSDVEIEVGSQSDHQYVALC
jgi:hypothetical protein